MGHGSLPFGAVFKPCWYFFTPSVDCGLGHFPEDLHLGVTSAETTIRGAAGSMDKKYIRELGGGRFFPDRVYN